MSLRVEGAGAFELSQVQKKRSGVSKLGGRISRVFSRSKPKPQMPDTRLKHNIRAIASTSRHYQSAFVDSDADFEDMKQHVQGLTFALKAKMGGLNRAASRGAVDISLKEAVELSGIVMQGCEYLEYAAGLVKAGVLESEGKDKDLVKFMEIVLAPHIEQFESLTKLLTEGTTFKTPIQAAKETIKKKLASLDKKKARRSIEDSTNTVKESCVADLQVAIAKQSILSGVKEAVAQAVHNIKLKAELFPSQEESDLSGRLISEQEDNDLMKIKTDLILKKGSKSSKVAAEGKDTYNSIIAKRDKAVDRIKNLEDGDIVADIAGDFKEEAEAILDQWMAKKIK